MMLKYFVDVVLLCAGIAVIIFTGLTIVTVVRNFIKSWRNN